MQRALLIALVTLAAFLLFGLGWLMGSGQGVDLIRQQAVDEGYGVREPDGGFRWRTGDEITRPPARRN